MKTIRLICDWDVVLQEFSGSQQAGPSIWPETLPLSSDVVSALWGRYKLWWSVFERLPNKDASDRLDHAVEVKEIERAGLKLWRRIRAELGDSYRVAFYSEFAHTTFDSPEDYDRAVRQGLIG